MLIVLGQPDPNDRFSGIAARIYSRKEKNACLRSIERPRAFPRGELEA